MTLSTGETTLPPQPDSPGAPDPIDLFGLTFAELGDFLVERELPAFRAQQVAGWIYHSLVADFALMRTLPAALRARLEHECTIKGPQVRAEVVSKDGRTRKLLLELLDGRLIETVLMLYPPSGEGRARATVCVSTQAGCAYGCTFCATGQMGFFRHLTPGEIVAQVVYFARWLRANPWQDQVGHTIDHITNLVFMGMGEPLHNYDNTLKAVRILNMPEGLNIGARHMTLSTVGLVPGILRLSTEALQVNLAISLHAPSDEMRLRTMPVTRKYPLQAVLEACRTYASRTNRQVTFEYVLLAGINDQIEHARELATLLSPLLQLCHVNLIPVNATSAGYTPPSGEVIKRFRAELGALGVSNSVRAERGDDIAAACGQLHTVASQARARADQLAVAESENQA